MCRYILWIEFKWINREKLNLKWELQLQSNVYVLVVFKLLTGIFLFYIRHVPYKRYEEWDPSKLCDTQDGIENIMINVIELILSWARIFFYRIFLEFIVFPFQKQHKFRKSKLYICVYVAIILQQCRFLSKHRNASRCEPCKGFPPRTDSHLPSLVITSGPSRLILMYSHMYHRSVRLATYTTQS